MEVEKYFMLDRFAEHLGIVLVETYPGYAKVKMRIGKEHLNGVGIVHGGAIFSLADCAFAIASNSHGTVALAISAAISFFRATQEGELFAEAREIAKTPRLATYEVTVTDGEGEPIALFQGTVYRKKEKLSDILKKTVN
ncbi:MAG: hotdog fold thioesterase [Syntrophobacterales bacterium]|nr:hotdog fold thioesterase [Syntrophobacterales bacterium]